jgi:predicted dehydrogenase
VVVAAVDIDPDAASALAVQWPGARALGSLGDAELTTIDAVFVCTPPVGRAPAVLAALRAGIPVLIEKPLGTGSAEIAAIAEQLARDPVVAAVGYMNRYRASVQELRRRVRAEDVLGVVGWWVAPPYQKSWWRDPRRGGALNDYACHLVDLSRHLVGEILEVQATGAPGRETVAVSLLFETGACGTLLSSSLGEDKQIGIEFFYRGGHARLEGWHFSAPGEGDATTEDPFLQETRSFLAAASGSYETKPLSEFADAVRTQMVIDAVSRCLATGRPQHVEAIPSPTSLSTAALASTSPARRDAAPDQTSGQG